MAKSKSKIHIKKENKGKFTAKAKRAGMSIQEYATHILRKGSRATPSTRRQAHFARNASKWKRSTKNEK